jgi:hypothetical protein
MNNTKLTDEENQIIEKALFNVRNMFNNRSPGTSGLGADFYK